MLSEQELSKIINRAQVAWSPHRETLEHWAAVIVRNVRYRHWDVDEVIDELAILADSDWPKKLKRRKAAKSRQ